MQNFNISQRWFDCIVNGTKTVYGCPESSELSNLSSGDEIMFTCTDNNIATTCHVVTTTTYKSLEHYLIFEGIRRTVPYVDNLLSAIAEYNKIYPLDTRIGKEFIAIEIVIKS